MQVAVADAGLTPRRRAERAVPSTDKVATMKLRTTIVIAWTAGLLALSGCGPPSVTDLDNRWHHDQENIQKYRGKYPGFSAALDDLNSSATKDRRGELADLASRAEKMKGVTDRVESSLSEFDTYESARDALTKLMKDKDLNDLPASKFNPANDAAKSALKHADDDMAGHPANMGEARGKPRGRDQGHARGAIAARGAPAGEGRAAGSRRARRSSGRVEARIAPVERRCRMRARRA